MYTTKLIIAVSKTYKEYNKLGIPVSNDIKQLLVSTIIMKKGKK
jgi:hypothetical protein